MRVRQPHCLLLPSQTYRNCYSHTILNLSFSLSRTWCHAVGSLQTGSEVPKNFGTSEYSAMSSLSPCTQCSCSFFPSEISQRSSWVFHPVHVPTKDCSPSLLTRTLQRHSLQGSLLTPWCIENKEGKGMKIAPVRHARTKFSMAEARATDIPNMFFLEQEPGVFIPVRYWSLPLLLWIHIESHGSIPENR